MKKKRMYMEMPQDPNLQAFFYFDPFRYVNKRCITRRERAPNPKRTMHFILARITLFLHMDDRMRAVKEDGPRW